MGDAAQRLCTNHLDPIASCREQKPERMDLSGFNCSLRKSARSVESESCDVWLADRQKVTAKDDSVLISEDGNGSIWRVSYGK